MGENKGYLAYRGIRSEKHFFFPLKVRLVLKYLSKGRKLDLIMGKIITDGLSQLKIFASPSCSF